MTGGVESDLSSSFFCTFFSFSIGIFKRLPTFVVYYYTNTPKDHYSLNRNTMITVENLSFTYRKSKRAVLHDFSLSFESGRVYGLLGKNGAGKSTLLYLMSGLLTPKNGKVVFHDTDVRRRLPVTLQDMFLVPEEFELPSVSLVSYVELNSPFYPRFSKEEMIKYLHYFEMDIDIDLGSLSMGQKKKVFMSFALATNTSLLLMDEPTNGLDIPGKSQFRKFIASGMSDDKTIVISTHQVPVFW